MVKSVFRFLSRRPATPELHGDDHLLRLPRRSDYRQWHSLRHESHDFLQPWEPTWRNDELSENAFRLRVRRAQKDFAAGYALHFLLFRRADMALLGGLTVGLIRRGAARSCMIGYWMGARYAGQGHMLAALKVAIPYIHEELKLHRIEAACIPENRRSVRLLEKAGFVREGILRKYLQIDGVWHDHLMFSRLPEDEEPVNMLTPKMPTP